MAEIIPAILPKSFDELESKLSTVVISSPVVQIDICDGAFVQSRTWPYLKGANADEIFETIVSQEQAIPQWENLDFEFDLMIQNPYEKIPDFISAGASRIVVHTGSCDEDEMSAIIRDYGKQSNDVGMFDVELGIALLPTDTIDSIKDIAAHIHFVQIMGIDHVGFQGERFDSKAVELVSLLHKSYPDLTISVDGGVNLETAPKLISAGASRLIVGSALWSASDFSGTLEAFKAL